MFFEGFSMQKTSKIPSEIRPRKQTPPKVTKNSFFMILGVVLGGKSTPKRIKIEVEIRARKSEQKEAKKGAHPVNRSASRGHGEDPSKYTG